MGRTLARVLITGGSGFLGSEVAREARRRRMHVRTPPRHDLDVTDPEAVARNVGDTDAVIHTAGLAHLHHNAPGMQEQLHAVNVDGTTNVMRAAVAAQIPRVVLVSSVAVYGSHTGGLVDENCARSPSGPYAESKYAAEESAIEIARGSSTSLTILRMSTIYGEEDPGNVARLIRAIDRRRFIWVGDGSNLKSLVYRADAARACVLAVEGSTEGAFNISSSPSTMRQIVKTIAEHLGRRIPRWRIPEAFALRSSRLVSRIGGSNAKIAALRPTVERWLEDDAYSAEKARAVFGFEARTSLNEGLRREVAWHLVSLDGR